MEDKLVGFIKWALDVSGVAATFILILIDVIIATLYFFWALFATGWSQGLYAFVVIVFATSAIVDTVKWWRERRDSRALEERLEERVEFADGS